MDKERDEAKAKSAVEPSKSTQEKVQESVRDNTPTATSTPAAPSVATEDLRTDTVDTSNLDTDTVNIVPARGDTDSELNTGNDNEILPGSGLADDTNK